MIGAVHAGIQENCLVQDSCNLVLPSTTVSSISLMEKTFSLRDDEERDYLETPIDLVLNSLHNSLSEYKLNILNHIAGFIQKKLSITEKCVYCSLFLSNMKVVRGGMLLNRKNREGLTLPSQQFEKIVKICETLFSNLIQEEGGNPFKVKNLVTNISLKVCLLIHELYPTLLKELDNHLETMGSHRNLMIKKIVGCYVALRAKHLCRQFNLKSMKVRVHLSKLILFKHQ